ncbi:hypothetical protein CFC21_086510, partial [Triticum aestivum]
VRQEVSAALSRFPGPE